MVSPRPLGLTDLPNMEGEGRGALPPPPLAPLIPAALLHGQVATATPQITDLCANPYNLSSS